MTRTRIIACCMAVAVAFTLGMSDIADAKRLGGGRSFGGSPSYQRSAPAPQPSPTSPGNPTLNRQQQAQQPGQAVPPQAPRSRFGGMLGGLLAGSLLGALFFGGGFGGVGMMDMLLLAVVAFIALKFFASRRRAQPAPAGGPTMHRDADYAPQGAGSGAGWDTLRNAPASAPEQAQATTPAVPEGFDVEDFLRGAKLAYTRLQGSWDRRDLDDIAQFTTPAIFNEISQQAKDDPGPSRTEILYCNASVVSVTEEKEAAVATVFFDVLLREDAKADAPSQVREVWHFQRSSDGMWKLDGIQQVEM